jgi:hypothetical protein
MFSEIRLLHEELNELIRIVVKETCSTIITNVVWNIQMIVTDIAGFQESIPIVQNKLFNLLKTVWDNVKLLKVAIVDLLKTSSLAALLKLYMMHQ